MSGTLIPTMVQPANPWIGASQFYKSQADALAPAAAAAGIGKTQAETGETTARAGLIGAQTTGANIQNTLGGLNLQLQAPIIQQQIDAIRGANQQQVSLPWAPLQSAAPGAASGGQGGGAPGPGAPAGYLSGGGGGGAAAAPPPVTTGADGVMVPGMGIPMPRQWYIGYVQAQDKPAALKQIADSRKALISQMVQGTMGQNGQVDPQLWNQAVEQAYNSGLITSTDAWNYYQHPERATNAVNANLPAGDLPAVRAAQAGATKGAEVGVENQNTLESKTIETSPGIYQPVTKTRAQWLQDGQSSLPVVTPTTVAQALTGTERSGPNAVSQKGARGTRQIEPGTFQRYALPGESFDREADRVRASDRAIDDLWRKYPNDPQRVAVGYFSGPGNVAPPGSSTPWVNNNNDGNMDVSQYVQRFNKKLAGVTGAAGGGGGGAGNGGPTAGAAAVGPPTPTKGQETGMTNDLNMVKDDRNTVQDTQTSALRAQSAMFNIYDALKTLPATGSGTGAFAAQRMAAANVIATIAPDWAQKFMAATTNIDPTKVSDMQRLYKELYTNTVGAETSGLPGARYGAMLTKFFQDATPNINMQGPAIKEMLNMMLVGQQMVRDYSQGAAGHFNNSYGAWRADPLSNQYTPMTNFDEKWTAPGAVSAPNVYEGASLLLNGRGYGDWSKGMSPEQQTEAVRVAHRADPAWRPVRGQGNSAPAAPAPAAPPPAVPPAGVTANAAPG